MSRQWPDDRPPKRRSPMDSGNNRKPPACGCECPMVAAARSVKRGQFRLAARYARLGARTIAGRLVGAP